MHGQIRHQAEGVRDGRDAAGLGGFGHIQLLNDFAILIAEEWELGAQTGSERCIHFGGINADDGKLTVVDGELFLEFHIVAQLHLAFPSPVPAVKGKNEGKFANQLGKLNQLAVLIGKLDIRESLSDSLIHGPNLSEKIATPILE